MSLVVIAAFVVGDVICYKWSDVITAFLCGTGENFEGAQEALKAGSCCPPRFNRSGGERGNDEKYKFYLYYISKIMSFTEVSRI